MFSKSVGVLTKIPNLINELQKLLPKINFQRIDIPNDLATLKSSEIIIADFDLMGPYIYELPADVKWIQGTMAGIDKLMVHIVPDKIPTCAVTRFSGEHFGKLMGEYVIANIINFERNFFDVKDNQRKLQWAVEGKISNHGALFELNISILGTGSIGNRIGKLLHLLGASINTLGRRESINLETEDYCHIKKYYNHGSLIEMLKSSDYLINVLPHTSETIGLLDGTVLEHCKERGTVFINIGRGSIISETSLVKSLNEKWISGAILDVFEEEPLRKDSQLWSMQNVFITPHVSGVSRPKDIAEHFKTNLELFEKQLPLPAVIDFKKGY